MSDHKQIGLYISEKNLSKIDEMCRVDNKKRNRVINELLEEKLNLEKDKTNIDDLLDNTDALYRKLDSITETVVDENLKNCTNDVARMIVNFQANIQERFDVFHYILAEIITKQKEEDLVESLIENSRQRVSTKLKQYTLIDELVSGFFKEDDGDIND